MGGRTFEVAAARDAAERVRELTLRPVEGAAPGWRAGAHVRVALPEAAGGGDRPYSLVNFDPKPGATEAPELWRLGVLKELESRGGSVWMHGLAVGDRVTLTEPENDFPLAPAEAPPVLLAGGIGITPLASMAAELAARAQPFTLVYAGRSRRAMAFLPELEALCGERLRVHPDDEAMVDLDALVNGLDPAQDLYVCGPRGMIEAVRAKAEARGLPRERLHVELFAEAQPLAGDRAFEVELASDGRVFTIPPGKSIIEVLEAEGVELMHDCQRGDCGICQTTVLEGEPDHRDVVLSESERASNSVMQICVSRAKSPRLKLDL